MLQELIEITKGELISMAVICFFGGAIVALIARYLVKEQ